MFIHLNKYVKYHITYKHSKQIKDQKSFATELTSWQAEVRRAKQLTF
jgi:hypothetical protein